MGDEYIKTLSSEEKLVFIKLFCALIKSDNKVDNDEVDFLKQIAKRYEVDNNTVVQIIKNVSNIDHIAEARKISDRSHALELLKELCFLANIDDSLQDDEINMIIAIARAMNIEDEKLILINRFVLDTVILEKTGRTILEK